MSTTPPLLMAVNEAPLIGELSLPSSSPMAGSRMGLAQAAPATAANRANRAMVMVNVIQGSLIPASQNVIYRTPLSFVNGHRRRQGRQRLKSGHPYQDQRGLRPFEQVQDVQHILCALRRLLTN